MLPAIGDIGVPVKVEQTQLSITFLFATQAKTVNQFNSTEI